MYNFDGQHSSRYSIVSPSLGKPLWLSWVLFSLVFHLLFDCSIVTICFAFDKGLCHLLLWLINNKHVAISRLVVGFVRDARAKQPCDAQVPRSLAIQGVCEPRIGKAFPPLTFIVVAFSLSLDHYYYSYSYYHNHQFVSARRFRECGFIIGVVRGLFCHHVRRGVVSLFAINF